MPARVDLIVLGRLLGTYEEWDCVGEREELYLSFEPADGVDLPPCDELYLSYETGEITAQNEVGATISTGDLATLCASLLRR